MDLIKDPREMSRMLAYPKEIQYIYQPCPSHSLEETPSIAIEPLVAPMKLHSPRVGPEPLEAQSEQQMPNSCHSRGAGINNIYILNSFYCRSQATTV